MAHRLKTLLRFMAGPYPVVWVLPYFMVLIVLGTIEQKYLGLYDAVQTYIYAPIIWWGFIPLPGGGLVLGIIFISLLLNFLFSHDWKIQKLGILLTHFGMLLLLIGGGVTYITKQEGFILLEEGQTSNVFYDYHKRVLKIENSDEQYFVSFNDLKDGETLQIPFDGTSLKILNLCDNCDVIPVTENENRKGIAKDVQIKSISSNLNKEENFSGVTFEVLDPNKTSQGVYVALEDLKEFPQINGISIQLQRAETVLPFALTLNDFKKIDYDGSMQAKAYESDIVVETDISNWPYTIKMNAPLRHGGYTFYQSSFDQMNGKELSVLNVVKDQGRLFPYISSFIMALGLLLHCVLRFQQRYRA